ncbi:hypothetical protein GA0070216_102187 [Micromonospora matsumotoense]|uniref:Uncharacterized protein n=1 Tax=Micromonospora matsumotoense TaxID=121616 RepID=A0A1C4V800_9ACTN|nr:hypothetical protein GA0070216_102187 [Micromonospora matsumotoense]
MTDAGLTGDDRPGPRRGRWLLRRVPVVSLPLVPVSASLILGPVCIPRRVAARDTIPANPIALVGIASTDRHSRVR